MTTSETSPLGSECNAELGPALEDAADECLSALAGVDTYDVSLRDHPKAWAAIEAFAAKVRAAERAESARLRHLLNLARDDYNTAAQRLQDIGDYAHDHSTGPAVPDALWEVRSMAYGS